MERVTVKIQSVEDARKGVAIVDGLNQHETYKSDMFTIGILQDGTVMGQTSLMFVCHNGDGSAVYQEMTARQFEMLYSTFKGAQERFANEQT